MNIASAESVSIRGGTPRQLELSVNFYAELHEISARLMRREPVDCSLQATMLVHDAFLTLRRQKNLKSADRATLLAAAAKIMRRQLVDRARARRSLKRGGEKRKECLPTDLMDDANTCDFVELDEALESLRRRCEVTADIVEMKFFGGLKHDEIARLTGLSERSIGNKWRFAKAWLYRAMTPSEHEQRDEPRNV